MTVMRVIGRGLVGLVVGFVLAGLVSTAPAVAEEACTGCMPWWHINSSSHPTNLLSTPRNEVQEITTTAGFSGAFLIVGKNFVGALSPGETAAEVQATLESTEGYGAGNVEVTGGPAGTAPLVVTSVGTLAGQEVPAVAVVFGGDVSARVVTIGGSGTVVLAVSNLGDAEVNGSAVPVTVHDKLPRGVVATAISGQTALEELNIGSPVQCSLPAASCTFTGTLAPYERLEIMIAVKADSGVYSGEEPNEVVVTGGGMPGASLNRKLNVGTAPPRFGVEENELTVEASDGSPDTQAGSHPFQMTSTLILNTEEEVERESNQSGRTVKQVAKAKDVHVKLPAGLIGDPTAFPQCTDIEFTSTRHGFESNCPANTAVGVAAVTFNEPHFFGSITLPTPVFNLTPSPREPARFGFTFGAVQVTLDTKVRTGGDYGVTVTSSNTSQEAGYLGSQITFWGVPGDSRHDQSRGWSCLLARRDGTTPSCTPADSEPQTAFLSLPTSCVGRLWSSVEADSWAEPTNVLAPFEASSEERLDTCNKLRFEPSLKETVADVKDASTPTGLTVDVHVPQDAALYPNSTAESAVKQIEVTLPEGMTVNPGGAEGLQACSEEQIGFKGSNPAAVGGFEFTEKLPEPLEPGVNSCPNQSKIATVTIHTPLLPNPLEGFVYLATPSINGETGANPFNSLISMYLVAEDHVSGTLVKLPMHVSLDGLTGQLVATVENPELPFEDAELHFFGGSRAPLATPALCGTYTTVASFTPWSGNEPVHSAASFTIDSGPNGSPCFPSPRPFSPNFQAGTSNIQAGAFTPFTTTLGHSDGNQPLGSVSMKLPPGLMGSLSGVKLCPEPQASEGTCGPESLIGHTTVTAGLGSAPAVVARPGNVYITGPFNGQGPCTVGQLGCAPFGLTIANPAETGPFDLERGTPCDCVVVRAKIEVNPLTVQLTVSSDSLPTIVKGIPLQLQHVNVSIERPGFTFNPTNCSKMAVTGTIASSEGAAATVSTPFQATNCASLKFEPKFMVTTSGKTSKADGAGVSVKLTYPNTPQGTQANIAKVKVDLPKQLPSRLTTLQKACIAAVFDANPANCPAASIVGHAKAITPLIPVPLEGPAYFVSHGGEAFPSLIVVLQGYGVTLDLVGTTFISKAGITSSTFKTVPDAPVGSFELNLPEGKYSALAANGNLCKSKLAMPTAFVGQNGAEIHTSTPITVEGCSGVLAITGQRIKKRTLTVEIYVPAAGRVKIGGKGLHVKTKKAKARGTITMRVNQKHAGRLRTRLRVVYTPTTGKTRKRQVKTLKLHFRK
ncbi:MAG: hypothetical protein ACRDK7_01220 [Solirubrobacteraceae bacterium]